MISYQYEADFALENHLKYTDWIKDVIASENMQWDDLSYVFCTDEYLYNLNDKYLGHKNYTDIITFDYTEGNKVSGEIYISIDRVKDNANKFEVQFETELQRVMAHGILHLVGYKDKREKDRELMKAKENEKINMFHVKQ